MHELFLTAAVPGEHVKEALKILQGLCAMPPVHKFERILTYEGPNAQLVPIPAARVQNRRPQDREVWNELNKQLVRQSHFITLAFAAEKGEFGAGAGVGAGEDQAEKPVIDLEEARGTLHFYDYPEPPHPSRPVNSRLVVHIPDEPKLPSLLRSIKYTHHSESLREIYNSYRDNVTFTLSRELQRKAQDGVTGAQGGVLQASSDLRDYVPFDGENKWVLRASVEVTDEKEGPLLQRGIEELLRVQTDLEGVYEFSVLDRSVLDTRVPAFLEQLRRR
ncbi:hypothetical protein V497_07401 [Pseudogymnoascus sp. VKM F-4516 (FW-969)]|nr:hypothetical protein V490_07582 [Pseudogymnoascus sp. VKM F-3557]KFY54858.1 hypothetical protein V497_07401 [Pseudogymnoascus sp. VKM F-4516 (FW-969)]